MAGTLLYRLHVDHIYQRRFDQTELAEALKLSHWYIVSRRPSTRIVEGSVILDDRILTVDLSTSADFASAPSVYTLGLDFGQFESVTDFRTYLNGAYFSVEVDGRLAHGDAWSLASLLSDADVELAAQEVLYVGQAFGTNGTTNAWARLRSHEKLQQIYEDHADIDCDIFVAPLSLERQSLISDDHIDDNDAGPSLEKYYQYFARIQDGGIRKASVDLIEHSLIAYFAPHYNEKLIEWRQETPTKSMRLMRDSGFRLIHVHLSGWGGLARFYSTVASNRFRSHLISHDLPPAPRRPVFRGISAEQTSEWRPSAMMVREGQNLLEETAERTGVAIKVFGQQAPKLRTPPGIVLPALPPLAQHTRAARDAVRAKFVERREEHRRATEPIMHPGRSTYDPQTGTIAGGEYLDGSVMRQRLHNPATGSIDSAIIFGDAETGRSNHLRVLLLEALMSNFFTLAIADVAERGDLQPLRTVVDEKLFAKGLDAAIELVEFLCQVIDARTTAGNYHALSQNVPAILLGMDDADALLHDPRGALLVGRILTEGGKVGVGVALVLGDMTAFEGNPNLMRKLVAADSKSAYTPLGPSAIRYLNAMYGPKRSQTWRNEDEVTFVVHQDKNNAVLGIVVAWLAADVEEISAKSWAIAHLQRAQRDPTGEWGPVNEDSRSWRVLDKQTKQWFLRRHDDAWLLIMTLAHAPQFKGAELIEWAESQIKSRYEAKLGNWQTDPDATIDHYTVFYLATKGPITPKDRSESIKRLIASMY